MTKFNYEVNISIIYTRISKFLTIYCDDHNLDKSENSLISFPNIPKTTLEK